MTETVKRKRGRERQSGGLGLPEGRKAPGGAGQAARGGAAVSTPGERRGGVSRSLSEAERRKKIKASYKDIAVVLEGLNRLRKRWKTWAFLALVFATWGGYSLYAGLFGLPCLCLGLAVTLPHGMSLMVNLLLALLSWVVLKDFGISHKATVKLIILSCFLVVVGFASADFLYYARL